LTSASQFTLNAAYPNPFNPSTSISYSLTDNNQVRVEIYNINGKLVETLVNEYQTAGLHQIMWNAAGQSSGVYFIKVTAQNLSKMQKVVYIK
jgi:flagellar hook assembly protein FlgD